MKEVTLKDWRPSKPRSRASSGTSRVEGLVPKAMYQILSSGDMATTVGGSLLRWSASQKSHSIKGYYRILLSVVPAVYLYGRFAEFRQTSKSMKATMAPRLDTSS